MQFKKCYAYKGTSHCDQQSRKKIDNEEKHRSSRECTAYQTCLLLTFIIKIFIHKSRIHYSTPITHNTFHCVMLLKMDLKITMPSTFKKTETQGSLAGSAGRARSS